MIQLAPPLPVELANKRRSFLRPTICISSLVFVCGYYFLAAFGANFFSFAKIRDSFVFEIPLIIIFLGLIGSALVQFILGLFRGNKLVGSQICRVLVLVGALIAIVYKNEGSFLGHKVFFWINETSFLEKVAADGGNRALLLSYRSSSNFYTFFIYTGGISLPEGRNLSLGEKTSLRPPLLDEIKGCPIEAHRLKNHFYVVFVSCGQG